MHFNVYITPLKWIILFLQLVILIHTQTKVCTLTWWIILQIQGERVCIINLRTLMSSVWSFINSRSISLNSNKLLVLWKYITLEIEYWKIYYINSNFLNSRLNTRVNKSAQICIIFIILAKYNKVFNCILRMIFVLQDQISHLLRFS